MSNLYPFARNGSLKHHFTCNSFFTKNCVLANFKRGFSKSFFLGPVFYYNMWPSKKNHQQANQICFDPKIIQGNS